MRPRFLVVILTRFVGDKCVMDTFVYDLRNGKGRRDALRIIASALWGGFHVMLIPRG
jgi:hypothetical protein